VGVGVTVLPNCIVTDEIQSKTLQVLMVKGGGFPDIQLMIVETPHHSPSANVGLLKKALEQKLMVGSHHQAEIFSPTQKHAACGHQRTASGQGEFELGNSVRIACGWG
jgi:hypothetical protein